MAKHPNTLIHTFIHACNIHTYASRAHTHTQGEMGERRTETGTDRQTETDRQTQTDRDPYSVMPPVWRLTKK